MRSWYKVVKDIKCKDGTTIKQDVLTFETTDKDLSKRVEEFFKSLMRKKTMSDDLIKRSDAIAELWDMTTEDCPNPGAAVGKCMEAIRRLPSADRPQGEWKRRLVDSGFNADWVCSECGYRVKTDFVSFNYCPNCGARMKGADDE